MTLVDFFQHVCRKYALFETLQNKIFVLGFIRDVLQIR